MLELCKILLTRLHLWSLTTSTSMQTLSVLRYIIYLSVLALVVIGTFIYAFEHINDIDEATESVYGGFAFVTSTFIYIWMILKRHSIRSTVDRLEIHVNERINYNREQREFNDTVDIKNVYEKAEQHCTKLTRRYVTCWSGIVFLYALILVVEPVNNMLHGQLKANNWTTLFKLAYPINEEKISSFFLHYTLDFLGVFIHFTVYSASSAFHIGTTLYVSAIILDMMSIMQRCDIFHKNNNLQPSIREANVRNTLNKAVAIHVDMLNLMKDLVNIMSGVLFIIIANSIIFMAFCLFQMEKKTKAGAFVVYVSLNSAMLQVALIWFFCYYSTVASSRLSEVSDVAYSIRWYQFSVSSQKRILMMVRQSNRYMFYHGFGVMKCNMETLKMMINSVTSYYLLLKKI